LGRSLCGARRATREGGEHDDDHAVHASILTQPATQRFRISSCAALLPGRQMTLRRELPSRSRISGAILLLIPVALVVLAAAWIWLMMKWSYSSGERAGWVQKFSRKGWICKTWEGEIALVTMPGTAQEKFLFTVWDDDVANKINAAMGKRVSLHYEEKVG